MFIKQVVIEGFKSYGGRTVIDPFDERHNVVVGRNGSGKSNFFYAIQFVLSDEFSYLRSEQRQSLLHEGAGPKVISAQVEIIFNNVDRRLPIDKDEISLKRVIGLKKDQYLLNKKIISNRNDVMSILESAGFSRSNPYYIVKQGKINQMATAPDSQRLKLLREIAGTRVYDDRCEESKVILKDTERKLVRIEEFLDTIEERLETLKEETEELKEYQSWDKQRRSVEYVIYERELKESKNKLAELENDRMEHSQKHAKLVTQVERAQEEIEAASRAHKEAKREVQSVQEDRDILSNEQQQHIKRKAVLTLTIKDLEEDLDADKDKHNRATNELQKLENNIQIKTAELENIKPQFEEVKFKEEKTGQELELKEQKRKELFSKQGRCSQFLSKVERDEWIQNELRQLDEQIKNKQEYEKKLSDDLQNDGEKRALLDRSIINLTVELERQRTSIDKYKKHCDGLNEKKDKYLAFRKEQYRKESNLERKLSGLKEDLVRADQGLRTMVGKAILNGLDSVRKVLKTFSENPEMEGDLSNYHGLVIENFECDKKIYLAVEVTAGNRLFHHIVGTDRYGTKILKEMNNQSLPGDVTFMPLNRLHERDINYPQTDDARSMLSMLEYDKKHEKALKYIFGKTLICKNLEVAANLARTTGLDCVTLEGDQVSCKGSLTGGYFNTSKSRLEIQNHRFKVESEMNTVKDDLANLKEEIQKTDNDLNLLVSELQVTETKYSKARDILDKIQSEIRILKDESLAIEKNKVSKEKCMLQCKSSLTSLIATREGLENELSQDLTEGLSHADQCQLDQLNKDIKRLTKENKEIFVERIRLEADKNKIENLLTNNLVRRRDELLQTLQEISVEDKKHRLSSLKSQLKELEEKFSEKQGESLAYEETVAAAIKRQRDAAAKIEHWKAIEKEAQDSIDEDARELEKLVSRINRLQQSITDCTQRISELGALPNREFLARFAGKSTKQLFKKLEEAKKEIKKYSHINKKALDQYTSFNETKERLKKRKEEMDRAKIKIKELMAALEQKKCEAILLTFKQVSKYFSEVFKELVPTGQAHLVMKPRNDQNSSSDRTTHDLADMDRFVGVGIKVSFTGSTEMKEMNQLSGGEKSLVALAIIFAIQKCDPAPFYLFDEIDQALDAQHRKAVAKMIHKLSSEAQFITTTFRPELLEHADKFYGVKFGNKISHIECVTREAAYNFVEAE
ncbi:hypothetical protein QAD02_004319 [Eretmocerus hayati]|uniref:Uncharacterized protein n=1 Tax=Eretmocerus hayati TaxID=131215 RepID=A0ACC2NPD8_9HYME|nr:hypothetical protein QAD02_004319 [Eretmocerus hayati]